MKENELPVGAGTALATDKAGAGATIVRLAGELVTEPIESVTFTV